MRKNFYNKYIVILSGFYAIWLLGIPYIFAKTVPSICKNISYNSNFELQVDNPQLRLNILPTAKFKANKIKFKQKDANNFTEIDNISINIRLLPLISGNLHINEIFIDKISSNTILKKELQLDKDFFKNLKNINVKCNKIKINNIDATFIQPNLPIPVKYYAHDIFFQKSYNALTLKILSELNVKNSKSEANINLYLPKNNNVNSSIVDISFDNFDIAPLGEYLRQYMPKDFNDIKGIIDIKVNKKNLIAEFSDFAIIMNDSAKSIKFPSSLKINSNFGITSKTINFENIDIDSKNIHSSIKGSIQNYLDKSTTMLDLNISLNKSKVEDIIEMLPPIIVEEFNVYKLKHYKFYGDAIANFTIKGDIYEPDVVGDAFISNGVLIKPIKNAAGAIVKLEFTGKYINFDVDVPAGGLERVWVKGGVELYNVKYADMRIWSTKNVDLETAEEKIIPIHEILNFVIGPVPIMDVKGKGNIDITVKGNRKKPHVWGGLNFYNVKTFFKEIPDLVLTNADATLTFNDLNAEFISTNGLVNGKNFSIKGVCNLYGKFDFDVISKNQNLDYLYNAIQTSTMIDSIKKMLPQLDIIQGLANLNLKVYGSIIDIEDIRFNENLFAKGQLELLGNTFGMQGIKIEKTKGKIEFENNNASANISAYIGNSLLHAKAIVKNNIGDLVLSIPKFNLNDILPIACDIKSDMGNILLNVDAAYKGRIDEIEYNKIKFVAKILGTMPENKLKLENGIISLKNDRLKIENIKGSILDTNSSFTINLDADNISTGHPHSNGLIQLKSFDLTSLNSIKQYSIIPDELKNITFKKGKINLNCRIHNNKINAYSDLGGISFIYNPNELPIKIVNGSLIIKNNSLKLNKINLLADNMPILIDGNIHDIFRKQIFDVYINSKPQQEFIDKYINKNLIYPVKIKGDIVYTLEGKGVKNNFDIKSEVKMAKDSSIYHLGATVGDIENAIVIVLNANIQKQNLVKIKEFSYDKIISSQGTKFTRLNMLKAKGGIDVYKDDLIFHDLIVKTQSPTDARIFNIIFRKPNIKQGQFTSNLKFNGKLSNPRLIGDFHIFETNIPFFDTTMKNITFKFKDKTIELFSKGEVLNNDITIDATLKNKLTTPYYVEKANLYTKLLDLNYITEKLKLSQVENFQTFDSFEGLTPSSLVIKDMKMYADVIHLRNIIATDFEAKASINEKQIINIEHFKFNIASGILNGSFNYNLNNNHTGLILKAKDINANDLTYALFDLNNQLYGDLTGDTKLSCIGSDFENCMKTLNGKTNFNVVNGRIPKLGSLEYLLKAGNLLKGGLTSLSINSVIDIITPLKTGDFSSIYGTIDIKDGIANDIEIATKGKDLSLFITGNYNFSSANAEMEVLGLLSKKISTMFGPLGNISLNTLFNAIPGVDLSGNAKILSNINKIPGIELSNKTYRKFIAEIKGNINGDNYVTSFKWIN